MKRIAVLFVHGFTGNNAIFDFLTPLVPPDYHVEQFTLDGHGGDAKAFSRTSMQKWKEQVAGVVAGLRAKYDTLLIVAHSMGCLFALQHAAAGRADALFLINPALFIRVHPRLMRISAKAISGHIQDDPRALAATKAYGIAIDKNPLHYYGWPRRAIELFREAAAVRPIIPNIRVCGRVFISGKDELISTRIVRCFRNAPQFSTFYLPQSGHFYYPPAEKQIIQNQFTQFLKEI